MRKVTISGKEYDLNFTFKSVIAMQDKYGVNIMDPAIYVAPSPKQTAVFIWGGVLDVAPKLTLDEVAAGIAFKDMDRFGAEAMEALREQLPKKDANNSGTT